MSDVTTFLMLPSGETFVLSEYDLFCVPRLSGIGAFELEIYGDLVPPKFLDYCSQLIVTRCVGDTTERVFSGLISARESKITSGGTAIRNIYSGQSLNGILTGAAVCYPAGTAYTEKSGESAVVLSQYVSENIGQSISFANRGDAYMPTPTGVMAGQKLTVLPAPAGSPAWTGARHGKTLIEIAQSITAGFGVDWVIDGDWRSGFVFRTYYPRYGRLLKNAVSECIGNLIVSEYTDARTNRPDIVIAYGAGIGAARLVATAAVPNIAAIPPACRNELYIEDTQQITLQALKTKAVEQLAMRQQTTQIKFDIAETQDFSLGDDIRLGDEFDFSYAGYVYRHQVVETPFNIVGDKIQWGEFSYKEKTL